MDFFFVVPLLSLVYIAHRVSIKKKITINFSQNFSGNELQSVECFVEFFLFLFCNMCLSCVKADYFLPSPEYHKFFCKINKALSRISEITRGSPCLRSKMHITARPSATSKLSVKMKFSTNRQSTEQNINITSRGYI